MSKLILHYEDEPGFLMILRCLDRYKHSDNSERFGIHSITIYSNDYQTAYFKMTKTGTIVGKAWQSKIKKTP